ncbi:MAG TPA: hypothetical protein DD670_07490, partial [Planctomycetaceae bacterium]|nr:hypothetical protein [Planctomycetaceae bacterium]
MVRVKSPGGRAWLAALSVALCGAVVLVAVAAEDAKNKDIPRDKLGAADVEYQEQVLDRLLPQADAGKVPAGVDPDTWQALIPKDNQPTPERLALGKK